MIKAKKTFPCQSLSILRFVKTLMPKAKELISAYWPTSANDNGLLCLNVKNLIRKNPTIPAHVKEMPLDMLYGRK